MKLAKDILWMVKRNSPLILSSVAISGVVTTAYLASRATAKVVKDEDRDPWLSNRQLVRTYWKIYIPAGLSGATTIMCIVGTTKITNKRAAAAQAAFILSERAYSEYRDRVIEEFGAKKDENIRASIAERKVQATAPSESILITGPGNVLCCELYTGRYFASDMEALRKAQNDLNARLIRQDAVSLDELYYILGLQPTSYSSDLGWNSDKMVEFEFSTVLTEDGRPCLAFQYSYVKPLYEGLM